MSAPEAEPPNPHTYVVRRLADDGTRYDYVEIETTGITYHEMTIIGMAVYVRTPPRPALHPVRVDSWGARRGRR